MKKFAFALMAAVATLFSLGFTSCSDDDDEPGFIEEPSVSNGDIYGMWETDYLDFWEKYDGKIETESQFKGEFHNGRIYFGKDGTYKSYLKSGSEWVLEGTAVWSLSGNKIIIYYDEGDFIEVAIKTLTDKKLELEAHQIDNEDDEVYEYYEHGIYHKVK